jgi:hypothetical protein
MRHHTVWSYFECPFKSTRRMGNRIGSTMGSESCPAIRSRATRPKRRVWTEMQQSILRASARRNSGRAPSRYFRMQKPARIITGIWKASSMSSRTKLGRAGEISSSPIGLAETPPRVSRSPGVLDSDSAEIVDAWRLNWPPNAMQRNDQCGADMMAQSGRV